MADFEHPRPKRPDDADAGDDVYGLADGDDDSTAGDELADPTGLDRNEAPTRPPAPGPTAAPLPRIWKTTPEPQKPRTPERTEGKDKGESKDAASNRKKASGTSVPHREGNTIERVGQVTRLSDKASGADERSRRAQKADDKRGADGGKRVLVEETPSFDTYESRQRVRTLIGVVLLGAAVVGGVGLYRTYFPGVPIPDATSSDEEPIATAPIPAPTATTPQALEQEASSLFERARDAAQKTGDAKLAISLLERVIKTYPNTNAAREAKVALARPKQNLPLFVDRPVVVADTLPTQPTAETAPAPAPTQVVNATAPAAPAANSTEVGLVLPANPAEPSTPTAAVDAAPVGRPLPKGFRSRPGTKAHESGWALEIVGDRDGATMVLVPGGEFLMGTDQGDVTERPAHRVRLSTYYIDQHEVTVRQFNLFEKEIGKRTDRARALAREATGTGSPPSEDAPVVMVSAKEAKDFATWAGKRLPTEAQWEMAARGPDGRPYPWGDAPPPANAKRDPKSVGPIMINPSDVSPFGVHDMAGNAWEWTKDWYDSRYFMLNKNQTVSDPTGPSIVPRTLQLAVKGGSKTWHVAKREGLKYDQRLPFLSFRCVLPVEGPGNAFEAPTQPGGQPQAPSVIGTDAPPAF